MTVVTSDNYMTLHDAFVRCEYSVNKVLLWFCTQLVFFVLLSLAPRRIILLSDTSILSHIVSKDL